jgi:hypothetical protein
MSNVAAKLLIKPGVALWLSDPSRRSLLGPIPDGVVDAAGISDAGVGILFADSAAELRSFAEAQRDDLGRPPVLWILYRKGNRADVNRDSLWQLMAQYGVRPITQVAVDEEWSALRFRPLKPGE